MWQCSGSALSEATGDVWAIGIEARGELCGEAGLVRDGGGRVGVAEETRVDPGVLPLGGREFFVVWEPTLVPAVDAVCFSLGDRAARGGCLADGAYRMRSTSCWASDCRGIAWGWRWRSAGG